MQIKIHKSYRDIVAICDSELVGKKFEEGEFQLDVKESFYSGEEKSKEEIIEIMRDMVMEDATFNIVGEESVRCALETGMISSEGVKEIAGVKFALSLL